MPGTSVTTGRPARRAMRCMTLSVYVSSSFTPKTTSSATLTAAMTRPARSAARTESTVKARAGEVGGDEEDRRVAGQREEKAERERERQPQGREDGRDEDVEDGDEGGRDQRAERPLDVDARQQRSRHVDGDGGDQQLGGDVQRPQSERDGLPSGHGRPLWFGCVAHVLLRSSAA
jgi:hypothetical protein